MSEPMSNGVAQKKQEAQLMLTNPRDRA